MSNEKLNQVKNKADNIKNRYLNPLSKATKTFVGSLHESANEDRAELKIEAQEKAKEVNKKYVNPLKKAASAFASNISTPYVDDSPEPENLVDSVMHKPIFWIWLVVFFITLISYLFVGSKDYYGFDLAFTNFVQSSFTAGFCYPIAKFFSFIFNDIEYIVIVVAITMCFMISKNNKRLGPVFAFSNALWVLSYFLKRMVERPRPSADIVQVLEENLTPSFPSGHVLASFLFFATLCYIFYKLTKNKSITIILGIISSVIVVLVMLSRVYMGAHWISDCFGGLLTGFALFFPFVYFADWYLKIADMILMKFKKKK